MRNFKKMVAAITLTVILSMSTVMADPGIIVSDLSTNPNTPSTCKPQVDQPENGGIIVFGALDGIIVFGLSGGIIVFGKTTPTNPTDTTCSK